MSLADKKCVPCEGGTPPLSSEEIESYLKQVKGWEVVDPDASAGVGGKKIKKNFKFPDFASALAFVNKIGEISETEGHHPDVCFSWGSVTVNLWTHAAHGLSENDFILAAKIDKLD